MTRKQIPPRRRRRTKRVEPEYDPRPARSDTQARSDTLDTLDDLLDEIDTILEAQAVLVNFRQRSGQ
jgi:hypothetical protein